MGWTAGCCRDFGCRFGAGLSTRQKTIVSCYVETTLTPPFFLPEKRIVVGLNTKDGASNSIQLVAALKAIP